MHVFATSKINLIIFAFLQQTVPFGDGWNRTTFEKSVPMSTYLVCFAVHQFTWVERTSASGKPVSPSAAWTWFRWQMCLHLHFFFKISFYTNRDIFPVAYFMQPILSDYVFSVVPLALTTYSVLQSFPISHLCELVPPVWAHRWRRNTLSKLIPDLKTSAWRNVKVMGVQESPRPWIQILYSFLWVKIAFDIITAVET